MKSHRKSVDLATDRSPSIRRPSQKRSRERFEMILNSADRLLAEMEPDDISIYTLAEDLGISPPSIYHFFPDAAHVFIALAERYDQNFIEAMDKPLPVSIHTWQDLQGARFGQFRACYNESPAIRKILLGSGLSAKIRARDLDTDRLIAVKGAAEMRRLFVISETEDLVERMTELIVINDALWALSVYRHGYITDDVEEQARRARTAFSRTFLPEYLPLREKPERSAP
jgi:AcrR family transcriptional regulator